MHLQNADRKGMGALCVSECFSPLGSEYGLDSCAVAFVIRSKDTLSTVVHL